MDEINAFVRAAALEVPPPEAAPEDLYDILPRQGQAIAAGPATFATSGRRVTLTAATSHFPGTRRPQPSASSNRTPSSQSPALTTTTSVPRPVATTPLVPLAPVLETSNTRASLLATTIPTPSPVPSQPNTVPSEPSPVTNLPSSVPNQPSPAQSSPIPSRVSSGREQNGAQNPSAAPATAKPAGTDAGVIVGAILLVLGKPAWALEISVEVIKQKINICYSWHRNSSRRDPFHQEARQRRGKTKGHGRILRLRPTHQDKPKSVHGRGSRHCRAHENSVPGGEGARRRGAGRQGHLLRSRSGNRREEEIQLPGRPRGHRQGCGGHLTVSGEPAS